MLPRRHIRVKVFQTIYSFTQKNKHLKFSAREELRTNLNSYKLLYKLILNIIFGIRELALEEIEINKRKFLPTKEDLKPNKKFVKNKFLKSISFKKIDDIIESHKVKNISKKLYKKIKKSKLYSSYLNEPLCKFENEKNFFLRIVKNYIITNPIIDEFIEEHSIFWNDDILIVYNSIIENINNKQSINSVNVFRKKDDQLFAYKLLNKTISSLNDVNKQIHSIAENWDKDRIALIDLILLQIAITEIQNFPEIPNKVTMDEYIEISKYYSTPKSKDFINGILDKFVKTN
ncbi:MAG: transcription antitermination factor NusB [Bacteroidota bacterium]|nr:transcription antitermination factor NusB [Bacteroidota bacterium]